MIDGLTLDYAATRAAARLAWRPDERLWQRLHAARGLRAFLDAARAAPVGNYLSGIAAPAGAGDIDAAFRAQWRARVAELAGWSPAGWRAALRWCAHLIDVPAVAALWGGERAHWMQTDPVLARYAGAPGTPAPTRPALHAALIDGPLAPLGRALFLLEAAPARGGRRAGAEQLLPAALRAWTQHWRALWPAGDAAQRAALEALARDALAHRARFALLPAADTQAARDAFAARALARMRSDPAQPVALFAWLLVLALDLERLRAEALLNALDAVLPAAAARAAAEAA